MSMRKKDIKCSRCNKEISAGKVYTFRYKIMCEDCAIRTGLFPLSHTGSLKKDFFLKDRKR